MRNSRKAEIIAGCICTIGAIFIVWLAGVNDPYKK